MFDLMKDKITIYGDVKNLFTLLNTTDISAPSAPSATMGINGSSDNSIVFPSFKIKPGYATTGLTEPYRSIYVTVCCLIMFASLIGNVALFTIVLTRRKLRTTANLLLLSLVGADLLTTVILIPLYTERFFHQGADHSDVTVCLLRKYLYIATSSGSLLSLGVISFDRMLCIAYPYKHERLVTKKRVVLVILAVWIWTIGFNSISFHPSLKWDRILRTCVAGIPSLLFFIVTPIGFYFPAVVMLVSYVKIYLVAREINKTVNHSKLSATSNDIFLECMQVQQQSNSIDIATLEPSPTPRIKIRRSSSLPTMISLPYVAKNSQELNTLSTASPIRSPTMISMVEISKSQYGTLTKPRSATLLSQTIINQGKKQIRKVKKSISRDMRTVKTISMLLGLFLLCWVPTACFNLYVNVKGLAATTEGNFLRFYEIITLASFVNCAIDPYLYTFRNTELRKETRKIFTRLYKSIIRR